MRQIQLAIANNLISSIDNDEEPVKHSKKGDIEVRINNEADEAVK